MTTLTKSLYLGIVFAMISNYGFAKNAFNPYDLTNAITRSRSIQSMFMMRWEQLVYGSQTHPELNDDGSRQISYRVSLEAVYYTGFSLQTDYGSSQGNLGRLYSDVALIFPIGEESALGFGLCGFRYGVFTTEASLNRPDTDPFEGRTSDIHDFIGTQFFDDLFKVSWIFSNRGNLDIDLILNRKVDPNGGLVQWFSSNEATLRYGLSGSYKAPFLGWMYVESLFQSETGQRSVPYLKAGFGKRSHYLQESSDNLWDVLSLLLGIQWRYYPFVHLNDFEASKYTLELGVAKQEEPPNPGSIWNYMLRVGLFSPALQKETHTLLNYAEFELSFLDYDFSKNGKTNSMTLEAGLSLFSDPRFQTFGHSSRTVFGYKFGLNFGFENRQGEFFIGYAKNSIEVLQYLVEAYNRPTWSFSLKLSTF